MFEVVLGDNGDVNVVVCKVVLVDVGVVPLDIGLSVGVLLFPELEGAPVVVGLALGEVALPSVFEACLVVVILPTVVVPSVEGGDVFAGVGSSEEFCEVIEVGVADVACSAVEVTVDFALVDCLGDVLPSGLVAALPVGTVSELESTGDQCLCA